MRQKEQFMQKTIVVWRPGNVAVFGFMNPVCGVILSAVLLGETDSLSVMPVAALVLVCMGIYIVNRPEKTE